MEFLLAISLLIFQNTAFALNDDWFCTEESSQRIENVIQSCGIGTAASENEARLKAFDNATAEFYRICSLSTDCKNHDFSVEPKRTTCKRDLSGYKCYRSVNFAIGSTKQSHVKLPIVNADVATGSLAKKVIKNKRPLERLDSNRIRYGMTVHALMSLIGTPHFSKTFDEDETIMKYSGKYCLNKKDCYISLHRGNVIAYTAFDQKFVEQDRFKPKIKMRMSLSDVISKFGQPYRTSVYPNYPNSRLMIYLGIVCRDAKMCPVLFDKGVVVQHEFNSSYVGDPELDTVEIPRSNPVDQHQEPPPGLDRFLSE